MFRPNLHHSACLIAGLLLTACSQGSAPSQSSVAPGTLLENPSSTDGFTYLLAGSHFNGGASNLRVERVVWGRLVDLYSQEPSGERKKLIRDLLVRQELQSDGVDYLLESHPVTLREELTILHGFGTPAFDTAFQPLRDEVGLVEFIDKGLSANVLPPFTAVPRNASVVIEFNDLLDPASVNGANVKVLVGFPPSAPFEARIVPDRSRGGLVNGVQYSTRVIVDPTVSPGDAQSLGLSVNARGFPAATSALLINAGLRIPTKISATAAQFDLLSNLAGKPLSLSGNGSADAGSPTLDVVRGFRTGGSKLATGDSFNGYLYDVDPPEVMGTLAVTVAAAAGPISPDQFLATLTFDALACAVQPTVGDLLTANNGVYEVVSPGDPLAGATVADVGLAWITESADSEAPQLGSAELRTPWDSTLGLTPGCFVTFDGPAETPPVTGVPTNATVRVTFSEPMDPDRVNGFDGIKINDPSVAAAQLLKKTVVGKMAASESLLSFLFEPSMPFKHVNGASETFNLNIVSFTDPLTDLVFGVTDLAGNTIGDLLPQVQFTLKSSDPTLVTGSIALRFNSTNEDGDAANAPEVRGQIVPDISRGLILPRAVTRFSSYIDNTVDASVYAQAIPPVGGVVEPLSIHGSRVQSLWRYADMGFLPMEEDAYLNVDVEGMAWMVAGAGVQIDTFPEFEMSLAHSSFIADDGWGICCGLMGTTPTLNWPQSGLTPNFGDNVADGLVIVSPQTAGYFIQSIDQFLTPSDSLMMPFPMNRNIPMSEFKYFTWRDTTSLVLAGTNSGGAPIPQPDTGVIMVGPVAPPPTKMYNSGAVPTIGLPLLFDLKTFPAPTTANGLNLLALGAVNSTNPPPVPPNPPFNLPFFRAHSTGGFDASNVPVLIDPASQVTAVGGLAPGGVPTPPTDNGFYYGNADFVTRVAVMHTIWFDAGATSQFSDAVTLPFQSQVPAGLEMHFAYRGAISLSGAATAQVDAHEYDPYGNPLPPTNLFGVTYLNGDATWKSDLSELDGARHIQVRVTFVSDEETGAVPELDAIGFSYATL
jgi:hypothetical protein